jgi:hypothetical protein
MDIDTELTNKVVVMIKQKLADKQFLVSCKEPGSLIAEEVNKLCNVPEGTFSLLDTDWSTYMIFDTQDDLHVLKFDILC